MKLPVQYQAGHCCRGGAFLGALVPAHISGGGEGPCALLDVPGTRVKVVWVLKVQQNYVITWKPASEITGLNTKLLGTLKHQNYTSVWIP